MSNVFADFLQNGGLYEKIEITKENISDLIALVGGKVKISSYCKWCDDNRVFSSEPMYFIPDEADFDQLVSLADHLEGLQKTQGMLNTPKPGEKSEELEWYWSNWQSSNATRVLHFAFNCSMDEHHHLEYIVASFGNNLMKIGQYPSVADLAFPELNEFKKVATKEDMKELRRAIGLYSQGIGIGSYVYLRRIFERMIDATKDRAIEDNNLDMEAYQKSRMTEKIVLLKDYLPDFLVSNKEIYGIISKGIHELSENDCLNYFPVMQESIVMILRLWKAKRDEMETQKRLTASISKIASNIT